MQKAAMTAPMRAVIDLVDALGAAPLNRHQGCWEYQIDERWRVALNAHREAHKTSQGDEVPPFHTLVTYNGWPAGLMDPLGGGVFAAGTGANEETFCAAVYAAIARMAQG